jgi:hypothetical protein
LVQFITPRSGKLQRPREDEKKAESRKKSLLLGYSDLVRGGMPQEDLDEMIARADSAHWSTRSGTSSAISQPVRYRPQTSTSVVPIRPRKRSLAPGTHVPNRPPIIERVSLRSATRHVVEPASLTRSVVSYRDEKAYRKTGYDSTASRYR